MTPHTQGRLKFDARLNAVYFEGGKQLAIMATHNSTEQLLNANARRLVAAWNAVEGISTEALEAGAVKEIVEALSPFAALCEALDGKQRGLARVDDDPIYVFNETGITLGDIRRAKALLAKARGQ